MLKSQAEPKRTKSYKLERVLNKNLKAFRLLFFLNCGMQLKLALKKLSLQKYLNKE